MHYCLFLFLHMLVHLLLLALLLLFLPRNGCGWKLCLMGSRSTSMHTHALTRRVRLRLTQKMPMPTHSHRRCLAAAASPSPSDSDSDSDSDSSISSFPSLSDSSSISVSASSPLVSGSLTKPLPLSSLERAEVLHLLDCLASPNDANDPDFDYTKFDAKSRLLDSVTFEDMQRFLRDQNVQYVSVASKEDLLTQYLVYLYDPTIKYSDLTGLEQQLQYITAEDLAKNNVRILTDEERKDEQQNYMGPDTMELRVLRKRGVPISSKDLENPGGFSASVFTGRPSTFVVNDMLDRKVSSCPPVHVRQTQAAFASNRRKTIPIYFTVPKGSMRRLMKHLSATVLLPDLEMGWTAKAMRVMADELACGTNSLVLLPDVFQSQSQFGTDDALHLDRDRIFDNIVAAMQFAVREFEISTFALCGVGVGGGIALETATDLHSIAALGRMNALLSQLKNGSATTAQGLLITKGNSVTDNLFYLPSKWHSFDVREDSLFLEDMEAGAEAVQDDDEDEDDSDASTRNPLQLSKKDMDILMQEAENTKPQRLLTDAEIDEKLQDESQSLQIDDSIDILSGEKLSDDEVEQALDRHAKQGSKRTKKWNNSLLSSKVLDRQARYASCWPEEELHLLLDLSERASRNALIAEDSQLSAKQMTIFVPKVVVSLSPHSYNVDEVGKFLQTPVAIIGGELDQKAGARFVDLMKLKDSFLLRSRTLFDFRFQIFDSTAGSTLVKPTNFTEHNLWESAMSEISLWLSAYSVSDMSELAIGAGRYKYQEATRFSRVAPAMFKDIPYSQPMFNHHLHPADNTYLDLGYYNDEESFN